ncbi:mechanosensitive ion channel protein MscS [Helicobacter pullorum]|uniref:Putative mechanosensitive ion channel n=1 Tax=Helicobacter pullorum TaxID=35818 RepID=A0A377PXZ2_9HELI|nr:mechanosensitive ion channel domain-containing protein [Helicobacter pullorum]OCR19668.1 mechanosensitive ion channel protein MscS [Helicobacter pullorum]STQ87505.1 putative mechanosensitive ion channel [Helicobacter pullorum]
MNAKIEEKLLLLMDKFFEWAINFTPHLISAILILLFGYYLARILSKYTSKAIIKATKDETLGVFLKNVVFAGILLLTFITALSNLGVKTTSIIAVLGTAGLAIALSLKDSLSNLASGIILVVLRRFNRGDVISVNSMVGKVDSINLFETKLTTLDNQVIIMPNSLLVSTPIINININPTRRMDLIFGIDYGSDIAKAKEILEEIFNEDSLVLKDPAPVIGVNALNASSVDLLVRFWVNTADYFQANITLPQKVKVTFEQKGIEIPYNKLDININPTQTPLLRGDK